MWPGTATSGTIAKTWSEILAQYPEARILANDGFLGIRVGEPYASGYTENLDNVVIGTGTAATAYDFEVDTVGPVITLNGDAVTSTYALETYTDPGATAVDAVDGSVTVTTTGTVDVNTYGTYTLTYTATDAAGNTTTATRTVTVERRNNGGGGGSSRSGSGSSSSNSNDNGSNGSVDGGSNGQVLGASTYNFTADLTVGSTGADVTALQAMLIASGDLAIAAPTGYFGDMTKAALVKWQAAHGVTPASGYFGPLTRAAVASASTPAPAMTADERAALIKDLMEKVLELQEKLDAMD